MFTWVTPLRCTRSDGFAIILSELCNEMKTHTTCDITAKTVRPFSFVTVYDLILVEY